MNISYQVGHAFIWSEYNSEFGLVSTKMFKISFIMKLSYQVPRLGTPYWVQNETQMSPKSSSKIKSKTKPQIQASPSFFDMNIYM